MKQHPSPRGFAVLLLLGVLLAPVQAQPKVSKPNPQAPVLAPVGPAGMQRGTKLELTLTGTNLAEPTGVWTSFPCQVVIPTDNKNGEDNTKLRIVIDVPATTPLGAHAVRLATKRGISNARLFCIDDLPQVADVPTNRNKATPQALPVPCVVASKLDNEAGGYYKIAVKAGQRLSFDVLGRRLGSDVDPQLTIYALPSLRQLAHDNDSPGAQNDPRLSYTFKDAGDYLIEIKDALSRSAADFVYRLRVGDFPIATLPIPLAAKRGGKATVSFAGPHVGDAAAVEVQAPTDPLQAVVWVAPKGASGLHGWPVALALSDHDELVEQEPNDDATKANVVPIPGGITGRFAKYDDTDFYKIAGKKGQKLQFDVQTLELFSPTLVHFVVRSSKGAELGKSNPQAAAPADQRLELTLAEDGDCFIEVQHLNFVGGPSEAYRLTVTPVQPGFELSVGLDRFDLSPSGVVALPLQVVRRGGYTGPIEVTAKGPPGLEGKLVIAGKATAGNLFLRANASVPMGPHLVTVVGKATIEGKNVADSGNVRAALSESLANLLLPPPDLSTQIAIAVKEKAPFSLALKLEPAEAVPGMETKLIITATREGAFAEEIALSPLEGLPAPLKAPALKAIAKGQTSIDVKLPLDAKAPLGEHLLTITGKAKLDKKELVTVSDPIELILTKPFELSADAAPFKIQQGAKAKLKVNVVRKGGYSGPIDIELKNLPASVTAPKTTLAAGQSAVEIEVTAAAAAVVGDKMDVQLSGTATALGNQLNTSPNLTVSVLKK